jgi:hypothetical protein
MMLTVVVSHPFAESAKGWGTRLVAAVRLYQGTT